MSEIISMSAVDLATAINTEHQLAFGKAHEALEHARRAGDLLLQAKATVGHGEWLPWLSANVRFGERTAQNYMLIAQNWPAVQIKSETVADLTMRGALKELRVAHRAITHQSAAPIGKAADDDQHVDHDDDADDEILAVQLQLFACLLDAWDEATPETREKFLTTAHVHDQIMDVVAGRRAA